jgi:hypothetical protein
MSENDLEFDQRITLIFIRERAGLVLENLDWYQRTWTCIGEEPGLISEKVLDLHQRRTWDFFREDP